MKNKKVDRFLIVINIIFFSYYSIQLLIFTDEFAIKNIGIFNHAIAGLCEILGIIFISLSIGLVIILLKSMKNQLPLFIIILLIQLIISLNFWRYVLTDSPGETNLSSIAINALIFSFGSIVTVLSLFNCKKYL